MSLWCFSIVLTSHYHAVSGDNAALPLGVLRQKSFQQNSGMLRQTELVIFSQTASLLLMNAAGRVSVSPVEITVNSGNTCPLWVGATQATRQTDWGTRGQLVFNILFLRAQWYLHFIVIFSKKEKEKQSEICFSWYVFGLILKRTGQHKISRYALSHGDGVTLAV